MGGYLVEYEGDDMILINALIFVILLYLFALL